MHRETEKFLFCSFLWDPFSHHLFRLFFFLYSHCVMLIQRENWAASWVDLADSPSFLSCITLLIIAVGFEPGMLEPWISTEAGPTQPVISLRDRN